VEKLYPSFRKIVVFWATILIFIKIVSFVLIVLPVLVNVAFITLLERKVLRLSQYRLGPNKVRVLGILQPIADAVKLFRNQILTPFSRNLSLFFISPILRVFLIILLWALAPVRTNYQVYLYTRILILVIMSFGVYPLLLAGWASNRKYALLGGLRGVSQTISYEIGLALILLIFLVYFQNYSIDQLIFNSQFSCILVVCPVITVFWLISCLAETNRTPFDFSEGESELVSGFNIEYGSGRFAIIFIAEYARIFFLRILRSVIILRPSPKRILAIFFTIFLVFFWIWARATLPRFRYDLLIGLAWKRILPVTLGILEMTVLLIYF